MDVAQLRRHVLARNQIAGVRGALAAACWLRLNNNPVALSGGFRCARGGSNTVDALGRGVPIAWDAIRSH